MGLVHRKTDNDNGTNSLSLCFIEPPRPCTGSNHISKMTHDAASLDFAPAIEAIRSALPESLQKPQLGFICGSGLSGLVDSLRNVVIIPYETIPGFSKSTGE